MMNLEVALRAGDSMGGHGVREHDFPRLASNLGRLVATGRLQEQVVAVLTK